MEHSESQRMQSVRTPPYVSFRTFLTLIEDLKTIGLPPRVDRSVLNRFSGGVSSQLLMALKSLNLTDDDGVPTELLVGLVESYGTPGFKSVLRQVIEVSYPYLESIDLTTATPAMFADAFKNAVDAKEDVLRKCRTFYLHAAKEAGIELGARLEKGSHPRSSSGNGRRRKKVQKADEEGGAKSPSASPMPKQQKELEYQLIDLMTEPDIDDDVKQSIWSLVQYLTTRKAKKAASSKDEAAS